MKFPITTFLDSFQVGDYSDRITTFTIAVLTGQTTRRSNSSNQLFLSAWLSCQINYCTDIVTRGLV